jgi:signal transduction histidine kinase
MQPTKLVQLNIFCDYLSARRNAILAIWRKQSDIDPRQTTARSLTRAQFNDHVPDLLDAFERKLRSRPGGVAAANADAKKKDEGIKHGLHRWQQGYRLQEYTQELAHLQLCLFDELQSFAAQHPDCECEMLLEVSREMILLVSDATSESTAQYERMQQAEAAARIGDLESALASINELEQRRAALIHQAVHDLNNDAAGVSLTASVLSRDGITESDRRGFAATLGRGVEAITVMLGELMELARLEAGQEVLELSHFNACSLVHELAELNRAEAQARGLFLRVNGPSEFPVEGDRLKVRRLLQNLLKNALKYTERGGVIMSLGEEKENWWFMVEDTGSGMASAPAAEMVVGLKEATASARESDEKAAEVSGEPAQVLAPSEADPLTVITARKKPGEGIGLSIVKRLCELLDASLEMSSSVETGTTFRVLLPRRYRKTEPTD